MEEQRTILRIDWDAAANEVPPGGIRRPRIYSEHPLIAGLPASSDHPIVIVPVRKRQ
jgi:hypothetical protein